MKLRMFWVAFVVLIVLHHDWWFWNDGAIAFGFIPIGLAYHAFISIAASALWAWAVFDVMADSLVEDPAPSSEPKSGRTH